MANIHKTAGTKVYISPTPVSPGTINAMSDVAAVAFFDGIVDWIEVEEVEELGEIGDTAQPITFVSLGNRRVRKVKGPRDAGQQNLVVGRDPIDNGQNALIAAEKTDNNYAIKIALADAPSASYGNSTQYYAGQVMTRPTNHGNASAVGRRTFNIGINTTVYEVSAPALAVPTNVVRPSISGTGITQGTTLTANEGSWTNSPTSYTYKWQADTSGNGTFVDIGGATSKTYVLAVGQAGDAVRVQVTAVNAAGASAAANSLPVGLVV